VQTNNLLRNNKPDIARIKKILNSSIDRYHNKVSLETDFYTRHFIDYIDELEEKKVLKRCKYCNKAIDYNGKREYCDEKCAKSARNARSYLRNREKRLVKARKNTAELRKYYKKMGVKK
jgi:hypothetical protein